ncbi:MAG: Cof-type HAD-IIB family hydrolase [Erysipelotrichales bacterium]|nr:Cof-type HAD-IIB family hydrolase [Erysipelotrichales bacterium]
MVKKYFFFDIDGTLTNKETGEIVPSAKEAIRLLQENGHFVCIATGRAYYKTRQFAKKMGIRHIVSNGGAAITINNQLLENKPLPYQKAVALCDEAQNKGFGVLISTDDSIDVCMIDDRFIHQVGYRKEPTRYFLYQNKEYKDFKDIYKIYIAIPKEKENQLSLLKSLGYIRFMPDYLTYQHDEKEKGIQRMIELVGGKQEDVVVFGDDYNDLVMFKDEWFSIAMGNACQELKDKADFITKKNVDNGILYACQYFGWI